MNLFIFKKSKIGKKIYEVTMTWCEFEDKYPMAILLYPPVIVEED